MIPYGFFTQIILIIFSGLLGFVYIKPTFDDVTETQDKIVQYQQEISKVSSVNAKLDQLLVEHDSVSSSDRMRLLTYMPDRVDTVAVPRDLNAILERVGVSMDQVSYKGVVQEGVVPGEIIESTTNEAEKHQFTISFESSYDQLKSILQLMEGNVYPLEVYELTVRESEGGFLSVDMDIVTYDREKTVTLNPALQ